MEKCEYCGVKLEGGINERNMHPLNCEPYKLGVMPILGALRVLIASILYKLNPIK